MLLPLSGLTGHILSFHTERPSCPVLPESIWRSSLRA
jgi:hypothetical protein